MIGTWISGGIVPSMIFYGLKVLSPGIFLVATLITCSIVSLGTGSSWSTAGTVGVALVGVGQGLGIPVSMVAGAIVSGAYFGDKMSPLSDTTNLAPAVAGTDVFSHIRHMVYTTAPGYILSIVLYGILGSRFAGGALDNQNIQTILSTLKENFFIHPILLIPPLLVIVMVVKKIPPLPALLGGTVIGGIFGMLLQSRSLSDIIGAAQTGFVSETGVGMVDDLLTRGGLMSMMETVALIICALSFGGIMERTGMLEVMARALLKRVKRTGSLVTITVLSCIGMNVIASDQYIAIVIPGRMYKNAFDAHNLHPKNLNTLITPYSLEQLWCFHVGHSGGKSLCLSSLCFLEPDESRRLDFLWLHGDHHGESQKMIVGIGTDIIEVKRIERLLSKQERFKERIFTRGEIEYCEPKKNNVQNYTARFAVKEALLKAIGTGWREGVAFKEIEVKNNEKGKPELVLSGTVKKITEEMGVTNIQVSISHIKDLAIAVVILESQSD
jgi:Na+/H+ antiporter NhaC